MNGFGAVRLVEEDGRRTAWAPVLERARAIVESYDTAVTLRQLFYRLVSEGLISNTRSAYQNLSRLTAIARRAGTFPRLVDRTRRIERLALKEHLLGVASSGEWYVNSSLVRALAAIRENTGRDAKGQKVNPKLHGSWLGAIGYMAVLDQIGTCFRPARTTKRLQAKTPGVIKALTYFSRCSKEDIYAIYGLRCALAHDYSLCCVHPRKADRHYQFGLTKGTFPRKVVVHPEVRWDGSYANKKQENQTIINLERFGDLVEKLYHHLIALLNRHQLRINLPEQELFQRYRILTKTSGQGDA
jgi:hypothetical protein